jgi:hypothetical protein
MGARRGCVDRGTAVAHGFVAEGGSSPTTQARDKAGRF